MKILLLFIWVILRLYAFAPIHPSAASHIKQKQATPTRQEIAHIVTYQGGQVTLDIGRRGFRVFDKVVFVERTQAGAVLLGKGMIIRVLAKDAVAVINESFQKFFEGEVYVVSRTNTPLSLTNAHFSALDQTRSGLLHRHGPPVRKEVAVAISLRR